MRPSLFVHLTVLALCGATAGCERASPTRPSDSAAGVEPAAESVTDARTGATLVAARPLTPAQHAEIPFAQQPITLTVLNGVTTGSSPLTHTFQVASDAAFMRVEFARDVAAGANDRTSVEVSRLPGARTYYWRVQVAIPSGPGPHSAIRTFTVGPEVTLGTPVLASPIDNAAAFAPLALTINNVSRSGPNGPISYEVQMAADPGFGNVIFSTESAEQGGAGGQTTVIVAASGLTPGATYYWRARAADRQNGLMTPYSAAAPFIVQTFNLASATIWNNPRDLGVWPVGARINYVEFTGFSMRVDFDRRDGPNRWPDVIPPGFMGPLQYTLGICLNIQGQWHCSAVVHFWHGRSLDDTAPPSQFWFEWWYDPARWGPMTFYRPREGEIIGVFVAAGDVRNRDFTRATCPRVCEVSNVALVPFTTGRATYRY